MAYVLGADLARLGQDSSVFLIIEEGDPHKVVFIKELKKNTMDQAIEYIEYLHARFKFRKIVCDSTGLGAGVADVLSRKYNVKHATKQTSYSQNPGDHDIVVGLTFTTRSKEDVFSNLKILMEQGKLKIPDNKKLVFQLKDFRYEITASGNLKLHHSEGGNDDFVDALACAAHGIRAKKNHAFFFG